MGALQLPWAAAIAFRNDDKTDQIKTTLMGQYFPIPIRWEHFQSPAHHSQTTETGSCRRHFEDQWIAKKRIVERTIYLCSGVHLVHAACNWSYYVRCFLFAETST